MSAKAEAAAAEVREQVRERYAAAAPSVDAGGVLRAGPGRGVVRMAPL